MFRGQWNYWASGISLVTVQIALLRIMFTFAYQISLIFSWANLLIFIKIYSISDALNETKDKVRYLESLKRHFDELYRDATPASIMNTALPNILTAIKQMESVSRYYARQGFLGLLFTKVFVIEIIFFQRFLYSFARWSQVSPQCYIQIYQLNLEFYGMLLLRYLVIFAAELKKLALKYRSL